MLVHSHHHCFTRFNVYICSESETESCDVWFFLQLKSPMQIMMGVAAEQRAEMEMMIQELEAENKYFLSFLSIIISSSVFTNNLFYLGFISCLSYDLLTYKTGKMLSALHFWSWYNHHHFQGTPEN